MPDAVIVAVITGFLSFAGVVISSTLSYNRAIAEVEKRQAVTDSKIDQLSKEVREHTTLIARVYDLEKRATVIEERIKVLHEN